MIREGTKRKAAGMQQTIDNNKSWSARYMDIAMTLPPGEYTSHDVRFIVREVAGEPGHPNAWGGAFNAFVRKAKLTAVKRNGWRTPLDPKSHARPIRVYRKKK